MQKSAVSPARLAAFDVLRRVDTGGWASDLLRSKTAALDRRDADLASELVMGCLRRRTQLDFLIRHYSGRDPARLDLEVRLALRLGIYQIRFLERIPMHAAVAESVSLVRRARKASAAGFVNAVLRKVDRAPVPWPDRATACSMPAWLLDRWDRHFGEDKASKIAEAFLRPPETWVRVPEGTPLPPGIELEPSPEVPGAYRVVRGEPAGLRIQDVGSQSIVPLLDLRPGLTLLDLCAAPGHKTAQALESGVKAIACDLHWHRLRDFQATGCARIALDGTLPLPFRTRFDRILVDAPCSGTGTLGRNPEIRWRIQPKDLADLPRRQKALLERALEHLAPGGRLVYSTCSLEPEENELVVRAVLGTEPQTERYRLPGLQPGDGFYAAVITS